jgi:hypothetical protein
MFNLTKIGFILVVFANASFSEKINKGMFITQFPRIELELNTGFAWLMQFKGIVNVNDNIYSNFRLSNTFLASEYGFTVGYQRSDNRMSKIQMGIGYSNGQVAPFVPGGPNTDDTTEYWKGVIIEGNYIHYLINDIVSLGFNVGFNFIISRQKAIPSLNLGLVLGII